MAGGRFTAEATAWATGDAVARRWFIILSTALILAAALYWPAHAAEAASTGRVAPADAKSWNSDQIAWLGYDDGLETARETGKPVVVVFHANWCPHCRTYRKVFQSAEIVSLAEQVVFVMVNIDDEPRINAKYALDGSYVPRTMVLNDKGVVRTTLRDSDAPEYQYFIDPSTPDALMELMLKAIN